MTTTAILWTHHFPLRTSLAEEQLRVSGSEEQTVSEHVPASARTWHVNMSGLDRDMRAPTSVTRNAVHGAGATVTSHRRHATSASTDYQAACVSEDTQRSRNEFNAPKQQQSDR